MSLCHVERARYKRFDASAYLSLNEIVWVVHMWWKIWYSTGPCETMLVWILCTVPIILRCEPFEFRNQDCLYTGAWLARRTWMSSWLFSDSLNVSEICWICMQNKSIDVHLTTTKIWIISCLYNYPNYIDWRWSHCTT